MDAKKDTENGPLKFSGSRGKYGCFCTFKIGSFILEGKLWPSAEHWYQAQKFAGTENEEKIRLMKKAKEASAEGKTENIQGKIDPKVWDAKKEDIMYMAVKAKFTQRPVFKRNLLETADRELVYHVQDTFWGNGKDGSGKNKLGEMLMRVRDEIRAEEEKEKGEKNEEKKGENDKRKDEKKEKKSKGGKPRESNKEKPKEKKGKKKENKEGKKKKKDEKGKGGKEGKERGKEGSGAKEDKVGEKKETNKRKQTSGEEKPQKRIKN